MFGKDINWICNGLLPSDYDVVQIDRLRIALQVIKKKESLVISLCESCAKLIV